MANESRLRNVASEEDVRSRNLAQAQAHYHNPRNRLSGFRDAELQHMVDVLDSGLMARWGYQHPQR